MPPPRDRDRIVDPDNCPENRYRTLEETTTTGHGIAVSGCHARSPFRDPCMVITGPEQGLTLPRSFKINAGTSHTSTHGAFGALDLRDWRDRGFAHCAGRRRQIWQRRGPRRLRYTVTGKGWEDVEVSGVGKESGETSFSGIAQWRGRTGARGHVSIEICWEDPRVDSGDEPEEDGVTCRSLNLLCAKFLVDRGGRCPPAACGIVARMRAVTCHCGNSYVCVQGLAFLDARESERGIGTVAIAGLGVGWPVMRVRGIVDDAKVDAGRGRKMRRP